MDILFNVLAINIFTLFHTNHSEKIKSDEGDLYRFSILLKGLSLFLASSFVIYHYFLQGKSLSLPGIIILSLLSVQFVIDLKYKELANEWNAILGVVSLFYVTVLDFENIKTHLIAWLILGLFFSVLWLFTNGLGFGDVKLILATGVLLTVQSVIPFLILSFGLASVYGIGVMITSQLSKKETKEPALKREFAFGPFIIIALILIGF